MAISRSADDARKAGEASMGGPTQAPAEHGPAKEAAAQDERLLRVLMDHIPDHIYFKDRDSRFIRISKALARAFGLDDPARAVGKTDFDFFTEEHARQAYDDEQAVMRTAGPVTKVERETWTDRPDTWVSTTKVPLRDEAGNIVGTCGISRDITERKRGEEELERLNRLYRVLSRANQTILRARDSEQLFDAACKIAVEEGGFRMAWVGLVDEATHFVKPVAMWGEVGTYLDGIRVSADDVPEGRGPTGVALREGTPFVCRDIGRDPLMAPWRDAAQAMAYRSYATFPLREAGSVMGTYSVYSSEAGGFTEAEVQVLGELATDISHALDHFETERLRKRAEAALRESEERLRSLFGGIDDALFVHDPEGRIIDCNDAACRRLGYSREELLAMRTSDVDAPEFAGGFRDRLGTQLDSGRFTCEGAHVTKDGRRIPVDINTCVIEYHGRKAVLAVMRDISDRKRAEEALAGSERKYRSLVESAVHGMFLSTTEGRLVSANPALVEMLGYPSEDALLAQGMACNLFARPEDCEHLMAQCRDADRIHGMDALWKRQDGTPVTVRLSGRPVRHADGFVEGFDMLVEDVTERRRLEERLRQAQEMEAIGQLAGGVAHEFNNLLTAVMASCDLLSIELPADWPHADDLKTIRNAAGRGAELTKRLLAFSRRQPLALRRVSLAAIADGFLPIARRVVSEDVELALSVDAPETTVNADPHAVEQILMNLVTNARDAMPGGGRIVIEVGRRTLDEEHRRTYGWGEPGEYVTLAVGDTGHGMDADTERRIFEPFFTTKAVGRGTGLGMAMVHGLVELHGGFVNVYSEVGHGTTVRLYLPAVAGEGAQSGPGAPPAIRSGSETILFVEDDPSVRSAASRVLERFGYTVLTAADGHEALDVLASLASPPDLLVSDVILAYAGGPRLLIKLREARPVPKILFTSGYTAREVAQRGLLDPGVPFLAKPWTVTELLGKVREVLDRSVVR